MTDQPDLVGLLYRADWTRLSLAAEVSITRDRDLWRSRFDDEPPTRERSVGLSRQAVKEARSAVNNLLGAICGDQEERG